LRWDSNQEGGRGNSCFPVAETLKPQGFKADRVRMRTREQ